MQIISLGAIRMKCQSPFSGKNKKNLINLLSADSAHRMVVYSVSSGLSIQYIGYIQDYTVSLTFLQICKF